MKHNFEFPKEIFKLALGGGNPLGIPRLKIKTEEDARDFVRTYGYDLDNQSDRDKLWGYFNHAIEVIQKHLLFDDEHIPDEFSSPYAIGKLETLLLAASEKDGKNPEKQRWACALLRVMHVIVHLENDLFDIYSKEIQEQLIGPIERCVTQDTQTGAWFLGVTSNQEIIPLEKFDMKSMKSSTSSILKLLARPDLVALRLLDKVGVRFVTHNLFDCFRVIRFLIDKNLISYPHIVSDQSANTLYPLRLFFEVMKDMSLIHEPTDDQIEEFLNQKLVTSLTEDDYKVKGNVFTGKSYKVLKFITRKLVKVKMCDEEFSFFHPFEVQIMDKATYNKNLSGPGSHAEYKERQRRAARLRVMWGRASDLDIEITDEDMKSGLF